MEQEKPSIHPALERRWVAGSRGNIHRLLEDNGTAHVDDISMMRKGMTALMYAASQGYCEEAEALLDAGADVARSDPLGQDALLLACLHGYREMCDLLVARGASLAAVDKHGCGVWHMGYAHSAVRAWLIDRGADPNRIDENGFAPLHCAAEAGNAAACEDLLKAGADPYIRNQDGYTALHNATSEGHKDAAAVLEQAADRAAAANKSHALTGEEPTP